MRPLKRNLLRMLGLAFALSGGPLLAMACENDGDAENAAEEIGEAVDEAGDEIEDAVD